MSATSGERWLAVSEAARALGLSRTTLLAAEDAGLITTVRTPGGHRRYRPAELRRYLGAAGSSSPPQEPAPVAGGPEPAGVGSADALRADAVRAAVRPLVQALDAACGGVYLLRDGSLRFCAAFGVPRWLTERLAGAAAPPVVTRALDAQRPRLFDAAAGAFPEPRSTGQGVAVALRSADRPVGVLFVVSPAGRELLPAALRVVDAFREVVAARLEDRSRITELESRLDRIALLTDFLR